jgi:hypothetical protein
MSNLMKSVQWELSGFMQTDGQAGKRQDESNSRFSQFCERDSSGNKNLIRFLLYL